MSFITGCSKQAVVPSSDNQAVSTSSPTSSIAKVDTQEIQSLQDNIQILQRQIKLLQDVIAPKTAKEAVDIWAKGIKSRSGALQYAVMSSELKAKELPNFEHTMWTTGLSSPWVKEYLITPQEEKNKYEVLCSLATSTGNAGTEKYILSVEAVEGNFYISKILSS